MNRLYYCLQPVEQVDSPPHNQLITKSTFYMDHLTFCMTFVSFCLFLAENSKKKFHTVENVTFRSIGRGAFPKTKVETCNGVGSVLGFGFQIS